MADIKALARLPQIRERFKRAMNMKIVMDKSGHGFQFRLPGFKYDDFDRAGKVAITKLNRTMETSRFLSEDGLSQQDPSRVFFAFGSAITVSPALYNLASIDLPLVYESRPVGIGTSSLDILQRLFLDPNPEAADHEYITDPKPDSVLASYVYRFVSLDINSRRSAPMASEVRERIQKIVQSASSSNPSVGFPKVELPEQPPLQACSFTCEIRPRYTDLDALFHVNQGVYLEYASECAARATASSALVRFGSGDICFRKLLHAVNLYSAESFPADILQVTVWEDEQNPTTSLYFVIHNNDGRLVYRSKFIYDFPEQH